MESAPEANVKKKAEPRTILAIGTILHIKPSIDKKTGRMKKAATEYVKVIEVSTAGTPKVVPYNLNVGEIYPGGRPDKNMHWSKTGWQVYGHETEILPTVNRNYKNE